MNFIEVLEYLLLGIVQGLTEFLPVSSSGHLVLLKDILGITDRYDSNFLVLFDVLLHFATLIAVCIYFFKDILQIFKPPYKTLLYLVIATLPAAVIMYFAKDYVDLIFGGSYLCFAFLITALLLLTTEILLKNKNVNGGGIDGKKALIMGFAQGVAVIPGISRSGSTICAGLIAEGDRENVAKFSFLMSIPVILGSSVVSLFEFKAAAYNFAPLLIAMLAAFLSAFFAIKLMMKVIQKVNFKWFALYLSALSALTFIDSFVYNIW